MEKNILPIKKAVLIFFVFACGYFISALLRAITATLSPLLTSEFNLTAGDLGLLAGGYFLGFASMQIPLGYLLDKHGPKKIVSSFLLIAIIGTTAFSLAESFAGLLISRILIGVGVSACLMGPLTGYRIWFADEYQQRANSWMLMIASKGFVFSTLPVQILLPIIGWRWIFSGIAILILIIILLTLLFIPHWKNKINNDQKKNISELSDINDISSISVTKSVFYVFFSGLLLWLGSETLIKSSISVANEYGISERVISISMVAIGTSIPELAASVVASIKKQNDLSIGNLIGSNIFNLLVVIGITSTVMPIEMIDS